MSKPSFLFNIALAFLLLSTGIIILNHRHETVQASMSQITGRVLQIHQNAYGYHLTDVITNEGQRVRISSPPDQGTASYQSFVGEQVAASGVISTFKGQTQLTTDSRDSIQPSDSDGDGPQEVTSDQLSEHQGQLVQISGEVSEVHNYTTKTGKPMQFFNIGGVSGVSFTGRTELQEGQQSTLLVLVGTYQGNLSLTLLKARTE